MKTYTFNIDKLCTIWVREFHEIEANSYDEALNRMLYLYKNNGTDSSFSYQDILHETLKDTVLNYSELMGTDGNVLDKQGDLKNI